MVSTRMFEPTRDTLTYARHHRARTHYGIITNVNPSLDHTVVANVHILSNVYLLRHFQAVAAFERLVVGGRLQSLYGDANTNLAVPSDGDPRRVMEMAISANDDIFAHT